MKIKNLFEQTRLVKRIISVSYDIFAINLSLYLALALRLETFQLNLGIAEYGSFVLTTIATLAVFIRLGMYRAVLRYLMIPTLNSVIVAVFVSTITLAVSSFLFQSFIPRSVPVIFAAISFFTLGGPRILIRTFYSQRIRRNKPNVVIYGAGATGRDLALALQQGNRYHPTAFIDDDLKKQGTILYGLRVFSKGEFEKLRGLYNPVKLLLAINNIDKNDRLILVESLYDLPIEVQSVPSVEDIASGNATISEIRDLDIADLLGRDQVSPEPELLSKCLASKSVLVTGAGGSIGSELCRQILKQKPSTLVLFELNEYNLYNVEKELKKLASVISPETNLVGALGSVQKFERIQSVMEAFCIDTVYHAAAYKHVPIVEHNVVEGIRNNVFGTLNCGKAAIRAGVKDFVLISTDKAVRPTNVMGASKRMAELVLQSLAKLQDNTKFTMVRFGNVLGSSGSVVPLFRDQIKNGGPLTVTHPEITRYFMLIPEAAELVIQAGAIGHNGQVFVLDMGDPVKIIDLARRMIQLMGCVESLSRDADDLLLARAENEIEIRFTGLRPGEKLYEELLIGDNVSGTSHKKILTALERSLEWEDMEVLLDKLDDLCAKMDILSIISELQGAPLDFEPDEEISDLLVHKKQRHFKVVK
ncbi:polysaccharide biosynthesis protein [Enterovibrio norvegicus]